MLTNKNPLQNRYEIPEFSQEIKNSQEFSPLPNQRKILKKSNLLGFFLQLFLNFSGVFWKKKFLWDFFSREWMKLIQLSINVSCYSIWDEIICTAEFEQFEERAKISLLFSSPLLFIILKNFKQKKSKNDEKSSITKH